MGPNVQMPPALSDMFNVIKDGNGNVISITVRTEWASFFQVLQQIAFGASRAGATTGRPTSEFQGRYIGMPYMDTTLGKPVFLLHSSSNVWVDGSGAVV